jgi:WD40 repeat protein
MNPRGEPHFELRHVYDDGTESEPQLFPLKELSNLLTGSRRGFLAAGLTTSAVLGYLPTMAWGAPSAKVLPRAHNGPVRGLAISPDGQFLATSSDADYKVWSLEQKSISANLFTAEERAASVALVGERAQLIAGQASGALEAYEVLTGAASRHNGAFASAVTALAAARDGATIFGASERGEVRGWSLPDWTPLEKSAELPGRLGCLAVNPDGTLLAAGDTAGNVYLCSLPDLALKRTIIAHRGAATHVAFKADGKHLMTRGDDRTIRLWNLPSGEHFKTLDGEWSHAESLTLARNGKFLLTSSGSSLYAWRMSNGERLAALTGHPGRILSVAISPDCTWAASGDDSGVVLLWDLKNRRIQSYLFDADASDMSRGGSHFEVADAASGRTVTYTLPCGSAIPPGAICTCNCVPGNLELVRVADPVVSEEIEERRRQRLEEAETRRMMAEDRRFQAQLEREERAELRRMRRYRQPDYYGPPATGGGGSTTICTCDLIYICHAGELLNPNPTVRSLAEQLLLSGRHAALEYLDWARRAFDGMLSQRLDVVERMIRGGVSAPASRWPAARECVSLLDHANDVVATMAAQCLALRHSASSALWSGDVTTQVSARLDAARRNPWQLRYGVTA